MKPLEPESMEFQFHNGTINTHTHQQPKHTRTKFQFHNGTINTMQKEQKHLSIAGFNSTTVQLIQSSTRIRTLSLTRFQFHNGTINTLTNTQKKQLKMSELANNKYAFYMINYVDG